MSINLFKPTVGNGLDRSAKQSNPEDGLPLGKGAKLPTAGAALCGRPQTQPSKRGKLKTVADPERRRWRFGITMRPVVPFVPFEGDSSCGSNAGVERRFFDGYRRFFAPVKEMGVHY